MNGGAVSDFESDQASAYPPPQPYPSPPQPAAYPPPGTYPAPNPYQPANPYQPNPYQYQPSAYQYQPNPYQPAYPQPGGYPPPGTRLPAGVGLPKPVAFEPVAGTPFGVAIVGVAPTASGPSAASLVAGVGSVLVSLVVGCFGAVGAKDGWGPTVSGAFAVLAGLVGLASVALGVVGLRQVRRAGKDRLTGRGAAIAGIICGALGLALTVLAMAVAFSLFESGSAG